jgi:hypothetical protein
VCEELLGECTGYRVKSSSSGCSGGYFAEAREKSSAGKAVARRGIERGARVHVIWMDGADCEHAEATCQCPSVGCRDELLRLVQLVAQLVDLVEQAVQQARIVRGVEHP